MDDKVDKSIRTNKSKGIVAISKKDTYIAKLKALSKYLTTRNEKILESIILDKSESSKLKYRSVSQLLNRPKLIHYINKHMNDKFAFSKYTDEEWLYSIAQICKIYGINDQNMLHFSKYQTDETDDFYKTIKNYYKEFGNPTPSNSEIQSLYLLYKNNIITDTILENMKDIIEGKDRKTKSEKQIQNIIKPNAFSKMQTNVTPINTERTFDSLSPDIKEFIGSVKNYIVGRNACKNCALHSKGPVILDTNLNTPGPVDIVFMGLNPGKDEITAGVPFVGKAGKILRKYIDPIIQNNGLSYMITNCILCWTNNEQDIPNPNMITNTCKDIVNEILKQFPPKLIVLIGDKAMKSMGVKGGITKLNGEIVDGYFILIHPSSILYNATMNLPKFEKAISQLEQIILTNNKTNSQNNISTVPIEELNIDNNRIIKRFDTDLTLFDIRLLDERVLYIMKDKNGCKKYLIENVQFPVFIKSGQYKDCKLIDTGMEGVTYLTNSERSDLNKTLYNNLKSIIK